MNTPDDAYNRILTMLFHEMLDRGIDVSVPMTCISGAVAAEPDLTSDEKDTLVAVAGQANRLLECAYNVYKEDRAEHWERVIDDLCGGEPPVSYIEHMGDES